MTLPNLVLLSPGMLGGLAFIHSMCVASRRLQPGPLHGVRLLDGQVGVLIGHGNGRSHGGLLVQSPVIKVDAISLSGDGRAAAIWRPASIFATRLVAMLLADSDPSIVMYWAPRAEQLREAASSTLNLPEVQQPGTAWNNSSVCCMATTKCSLLGGCTTMCYWHTSCCTEQDKTIPDVLQNSCI